MNNRKYLEMSSNKLALLEYRQLIITELYFMNFKFDMQIVSGINCYRKYNSISIYKGKCTLAMQ